MSGPTFVGAFKEPTIAFLLHIAFQDGFDSDTVVVRLDGRQVLRRDGVATDPRFGAAGTFEVSVEAGEHSVEVELPEKGAKDALRLEVDAATYLGVSVEGTGLRFRLSETRFGYA